MKKQLLVLLTLLTLMTGCKDASSSNSSEPPSITTSEKVNIRKEELSSEQSISTPDSTTEDGSLDETDDIAPANSKKNKWYETVWFAIRDFFIKLWHLITKGKFAL